MNADAVSHPCASLRRTFVYLAVGSMILAVLVAISARVHAAGPYGADNGWAVDNDGTVLLTSTVAAQMSAGETGWLRIEMRLFGAHTNWDPGILSLYDAAVNNARNAGIQVLLLIDGGSWPRDQTNWCANNAENNSGANGDNLYVEAYATNAVAPIVQHFRDRVKYYELWNEPNSWTAVSNTVFTGGTFIYPSNYGWLLTRSWAAVHATLGFEDVTLFFGGVFGHNIGGVSSYANAGAQYIDDTYSTGTNVHKGASFNYAKTNFGVYPLDGIGEHVYLSSGGLAASNTFRQYEDWVHQACTKYEGANTTKKTYITEFGWQTTNTANPNKGVSLAIQDTNLITAFSAIHATPYVRMAIWFQWKDNPAGSLWYGVVDSSNNPKQSNADYQQFERFEGRFSNGTTNSPIQNYYYALGQAVLGDPFDNGHGPSVYLFLDGHAQDFQGGSHQSLTIVTSTNGTFEINDVNGFWSFYAANNGPSRIGFPVGNAFVSGGETRQNFTFGSLIYSAGSITWAPTRPILFETSQSVLTWTGYYSLQSATNPAGSFGDVPGAGSPYTNQSASPSGYFRLKH